MKPDWDKLMEEYEGNSQSLVADVDCTAAGKPLCDKNDVKGFPTIKYGDPNNLEDYSGGREFDELQKFAHENLGPICGVENLDLCGSDVRAKIEEFLEMDDAALDEAIEKWQKVEDEANEHFTTEIKKLQEKYEELKDDKEWVLQNALDTGLKVARQVRSHRSPKKAAAAEGGASFLAPLAPFAPLIVMLLIVVVVYFVFYHNQSLEPAIKLTEKEKARLRKKQMKKDKKRGSN